MLSLTTRKVKITCKNCGTGTSRNNLFLRKKICSLGTLYNAKCPSFSTTSHDDQKYIILLESTASQTLPLLSSVNFVMKSFQDFTLNYDIKKTQDGFFQDKNWWSYRYHERSECYESKRGVAFMSAIFCGFCTWKGETQGTRLRGWKSHWNNRQREAWSFFEQFKKCSMSDLLFGFILKSREDAGCSYFYAHENNTLLDQSKLVCNMEELT